MEIFELRYFLGVAAKENIHRSSEKLHVSPASLSKAITRLEEQLGVKLFVRDGRNIKLTDHGRLLQKRASEIIQLEESARLELTGLRGTIQVMIAGPETLMAHKGIEIVKNIQKQFPLSRFDYICCSDKEALDLIIKGQAHIAMVTDDISSNSDFLVKTIGQTTFQTFVGPGHALYSVAKNKKDVSIDEVLKYPFVSPSNPLLGKVGPKQSLDGWRDDIFPRIVTFHTSSLKILEETLSQGQAIAYLPDYFETKLKALILKITGCPYSCQQKIKMVTKKNKTSGWQNQIF